MKDKNPGLFAYEAADILETRNLPCEIKIGGYIKEADSIALTFLKDGRVIRELRHAEPDRPPFRQCLRLHKQWRNVFRSTTIVGHDELHYILSPGGTESLDLYCLAATEHGRGDIYKGEDGWIALPRSYKEYKTPVELALMNSEQRMLDEVGPLKGGDAKGDIDYIDSVIDAKTRFLRQFPQKRITMYYPADEIATIMERPAIAEIESMPFPLRPLLSEQAVFSTQDPLVKCTLPQEGLVFYVTPKGLFAPPGTRLNAEQAEAFRDFEKYLTDPGEDDRLLGKLEILVQERLSASLNKARSR